jgi:hypothetical protein
MLFVTQFACVKNDATVFSCYRSEHKSLPYSCVLKRSAGYLGLSMGMKKSRAFDGLIKTESPSEWNLYSRPAARYFPLASVTSGQYWSAASDSDRWMIRSKGSPCARTRYMVLLFMQERLSELIVFCQKLHT